MSITVKWEAIDPTKQKHLKSDYTSGDYNALREVFPEDLTPEDIPTLLAMGIAARNTGFYDEIVELLRNYPGIRLWSEY